MGVLHSGLLSSQEHAKPFTIQASLPEENGVSVSFMLGINVRAKNEGIEKRRGEEWGSGKKDKHSF